MVCYVFTARLSDTLSVNVSDLWIYKFVPIKIGSLSTSEDVWTE